MIIGHTRTDETIYVSSHTCIGIYLCLWFECDGDTVIDPLSPHEAAPARIFASLDFKSFLPLLLKLLIPLLQPLSFAARFTT